MRRTVLIISFVVVGLTAAIVSADQSPSAKGPVSLSVLGGASAGSGNAGAAVGATLAVAVSDRVSFEGRGVFLDRGPGASALDLNASLLVSLLEGRKASPYIAVGGGVYRAMFDLRNQGLFGMMAAGLPPGSRLVPLRNGQGWGAMPGAGMTGWPSGQNFGSGWMMGGFMWNNTAQSGPTYSANQMPMFYSRRMESLTVPENGGLHMRSFTDPALAFGGGVRFDLTPALYVRPDIRALTIVGGGDSYTIGSATFSVGYRF